MDVRNATHTVTRAQDCTQSGPWSCEKAKQSAAPPCHLTTTRRAITPPPPPLILGHGIKVYNIITSVCLETD